MPWTPKEFAEKHNHSLTRQQSRKAADIANAMLEKGVDEGEAIATANARAKGRAGRSKKSVAETRYGKE